MHVKQILDIARNNVILYRNDQVFIVIVDAGKDKYPFFLKAEFKTNGEEKSLTIRFFKEVEHITKGIEKMTDKYDESLEVLLQVK